MKFIFRFYVLILLAFALIPFPPQSTTSAYAASYPSSLNIANSAVTNNSIELSASDVALNAGDEYFMGCTEFNITLGINAPSYTTSGTSSTLKIQNLKAGTEYDCNILLHLNDDSYIAPSQNLRLKTTGTLIFANYSASIVSDPMAQNNVVTIQPGEIITFKRITNSDTRNFLTKWHNSNKLVLPCSMTGSPEQESMNALDYQCTGDRESEIVVYFTMDPMGIGDTAVSNKIIVKIEKPSEPFFSVNLTSSPTASSTGTIKSEIGDQIDFSFSVETNYDSDSGGVSWIWDRSKLNCSSPAPEKLNCSVIATGSSTVSVRNILNLTDGTQVTKDSNQIKVVVETKTPPAGYEDDVLTEFENNPFPDTSINDLEGKAAAELYRRAVIGGFPDGEFKGTRNVNRAEAAKFLLLARGTAVQELTNNGKFWDVKEGEWYVKYVMTAAQKGIISGHPDGSFKPGDTVNTAEFIKMLTLAFNLPKNLSYSYSDVDSSDWFAQYAGVAQKYNLFPKRTAGKLQPSRHLSRNEVAVAIYQYLANR